MRRRLRAIIRPANDIVTWLLEATGEDTDLAVHEVLIRLCSSFLDQGFADWELPDRDHGLYRSFLNLFGDSFASPTRWHRDLHREVVSAETGSHRSAGVDRRIASLAWCHGGGARGIHHTDVACPARLGRHGLADGKQRGMGSPSGTGWQSRRIPRCSSDPRSTLDCISLPVSISDWTVLWMRFATKRPSTYSKRGRQWHGPTSIFGFSDRSSARLEARGSTGDVS